MFIHAFVLLYSKNNCFGFKTPNTISWKYDVPFISPVIFVQFISNLHFQRVYISDRTFFRANLLLGEPPSRGLLYFAVGCVRLVLLSGGGWLLWQDWSRHFRLSPTGHCVRDVVLRSGRP